MSSTTPRRLTDMLIAGATTTDLERENERLRAELRAQTLELRR
jgi:hypothetical protein